MNIIARYYHWLHGQWPAGTVEKLPHVGEHGSTNVPGLHIIGDLAGVPLLKFAAESATLAVQAIAREPEFSKVRPQSASQVDIAIIGGGVAGISAAMEAKKAGLTGVIYEAARPFFTLENFPQGKPIFTYPVALQPSGGLNFDHNCEVKESLLAELESQRAAAGITIVTAHVNHVSKEGADFAVHSETQIIGRARRVIVAIGRTGNFRQLGVPGEDLPKVTNRLHDPKEFSDQDVLVVGGGDSAVEAAIALSQAGARTTLAYRGNALTRPKPDNLTALQATNVTVILDAAPVKISETEVTLTNAATLSNQAVFILIGREAPLDFFRRSGITIAGEWQWQQKLSLALMVLLSLFIYHWKSWVIPACGIDPSAWWTSGEAAPTSFLHTLVKAASERGFYYSLAYCLLVSWFGWKRVQRRRTPYVRLQTTVLALIQWLPLFLLPELILPWLGRNGWFTSGMPLSGLANAFFPMTDGLGMEREYWRAYGFILAWPLFVYNWFTTTPLWGWLIVGSLQTFVLIPWIVRKWGKGAYCGWICSCGALAETMGDAHRHKMPHGRNWNKANMIGQVFFTFALVLMLMQILAWCGVPGMVQAFAFLFKGLPVEGHGLPIFNYKYFVDLLWAGVIGVACYFHFSGRVWCRVACPLAALMHIYARFGKFRIFAEKAKCISCNVCTSVCHQGIDVMSFANQGKPMADPQCVRCSACVSDCPTGVLKFGRLEKGERVVLDKLSATHEP